MPTSTFNRAIVPSSPGALKWYDDLKDSEREITRLLASFIALGLISVVISLGSLGHINSVLSAIWWCLSIIVTVALCLALEDAHQMAKNRFKNHPPKRENGHLDLSSKPIWRLAQAYSNLFENAKRGNPLAQANLEAAHQSVFEVSDLLSGNPIMTSAESEYVSKRYKAIESILTEIEIEEKEISKRLTAERLSLERSQHQMRESTVTAIVEFENRTGLNSLFKFKRF